MRINTNLNAMTALNSATKNTALAGSSMEKLSSGLKINKAADNATGLAISEKMRSQIRGLDQASQNTQDGISVVQTAEGAIEEVGNIVQRMRELSVQSSNDTNTAADRESIQKEIEQLTEEIDRIGNNTEFNTQSLLKGDGSTKLEASGIAIPKMEAGADRTTNEAKVTIKAGATAGAANIKLELNGQAVNISYTATATKTENAKNIADELQKSIDSNDVLKGQYKVTVSSDTVTLEAVKGGKFEGAQGNIKLTTAGTKGEEIKDASKANSPVMAANDVSAGTTTAATAASVTIDLDDAATKKDNLYGTGITIGNTQIEFYDASEGQYNGNAVGVDISTVNDGEGLVNAIIKQAGDKIEGATVSVDAGATSKLIISSVTKGANSTVKVEDGAKNEGFEATFQVGANSNQTISISIGDMRADALGVKKVDLTTAEGSQEATATIQAAIEKVSTERAGLGAVQNRLEYTISNLDNTTENLTSAESTLRDVDMAKEMMTFSKNNILNQAAQAMLAQANQQPQNVLSLLR